MTDTAKVESGAKDVGAPQDGSRSSGGAVRRIVIHILSGAEDGLTIKQIESAVAEESPASAHDPIETIVDTLVKDELVGRARDSRRLCLTDAGKRLASGIRALASG